MHRIAEARDVNVGGGTGSGGGIDWVGNHRGVIGAYFARRRAKNAILIAAEEMLAASGQPVPEGAPWYRRARQWIRGRLAKR